MGVDLTTIKCPICGEMIEGSGAYELTMELRNHLVAAHDMKDLRTMDVLMPSEVRKEGERMEAQPPCPDVGPAAPLDMPKDRRAMESENVRGECLQGPANPLDAPKSPEQRARLEGTGKAMGTPALMLYCPICGEPIGGQTDADLTDQLQKHMRMAHDIKPAIRAKM